MPILDDICIAKTKSIAAKDVAETGKYPVFGATGLIGYLDTYEAENTYALYGANLNNKEFKSKKIEEFNKIDYSFEKIKYYLENCEDIRD